MTYRKEVVHGLWIKGGLSSLEALCIKSYLTAGYQFILWVYDKPQQYSTIDGLIVRDANEIIPSEQVFAYKHSNQFGHGKGSYAGFSDIFRYKLLYEYGGWWTDMDVTCISYLPKSQPYLFRLSKHRESMIVGNIMKVPPKTDLMLACYRDALKIGENNRDWMAPIRILNHHIDRLGLRQYVQVVSNDDSWPDVCRLITSLHPLPENWHFIHWMNEEFRRLDIDKNRYVAGSTLGYYFNKFNLAKPLTGFFECFLYRLKASRIYYAFLHIRRETILQSIYYLLYNIYYAISDLYFVRIKPHFDIGKFFRRLLGIGRS